MGNFRFFADVACCMVALLAFLTARRSPQHWRIAALFAWMGLSDAIAFALQALRADAPRPYVGVARLAFHVDQMITLSWSFLFVALCVHFFLGKRVRFVLVAWGVALAICVVSYPALSKDRLGVFYDSIWLTGVVVSWGAIFWGMLRRRDLDPGISHLVLILAGAVDAATFAVHLSGRFFENWPAVQLADILLWVACAAVHLWWLGRRAPAHQNAIVRRT